MLRTRRQILHYGAATTGALLLPHFVRAQTVRFDRDPFSLGVAAGFPSPTSTVLWTRLVPDPFSENGGMPAMPVAVQWQLASDAEFRSILAGGETAALPEFAHSVHVEVEGLQPNRPYWYRFFSGAAESPIGRTKTAPANAASVRSQRFALACCQHYEANHYAAYAAMAQEDLDLIIHVGDYIYENAGVARVRSHDLAEAKTLTDYRLRYALYKSDPALQAAHAAAPWIATWDDHEVVNDYAGNIDRVAAPSPDFAQRRAAAYQAYYEHLPLPASMRPRGNSVKQHGYYDFGDLLRIYSLDARQYRSAQSCGSRLAEPCSEWSDDARTMLGAEQETWLSDSFTSSRKRWNVVAQQVVFASMDQSVGPEVGFWMDGWSGYPAARKRLIDSIVEPGVSNPVILSGDIHAWLLNDVHARPGDNDSPVVATEVVTTSISSAGPLQATLDAWRRENPNVLLANSEDRGFTRLTFAPERLDIDLVAVDDPGSADSGTHTYATWHVLNGQPGAVR